MSFVYKQDGVNSLVLEVQRATNAVITGLTSVKEASNDITSRTDWQGNKATAIKDYLANVHGAIIASLGLLMKDIYDQAMLYQDGYHSIDGDAHAIIPETELTDMGTRLTQMAPIFDAISAEAESIVRSVAHIGTIPYAGIQGFPEGIEALTDKLDTLCDDINQHETCFQSQFEAERNLISSVKAMLAEARGFSLESFSNGALAKSENYRNLVNAYQALAKVVQNNSSAVEHAESSFQQTYKVLDAEYQERIEKANRAKFWTGLLTAAVSAVVVTATGGAGVVLVGAVCGAANAVVGSIYDQQIGSVGYPGSVNGWQVAGAGLIGGFVGAATSFVSAGFGNTATNLSATGGKKVVEKIVLEGLKSTVTGMAERAGNACYDSIAAGEPVLDNIKNTFSSAVDLKKMAGDFAGGCVGGAVSQVIETGSEKIKGMLFSGQSPGGVVSKNSQLVIKADSPYLQQGYSIASDTFKETGKGFTKRYSRELVETGDFGNALEKAAELDKIIEDASSTLASKTASTVTADVKVVQVQRSIDRVQQQVDAESATWNEQNEEICAERGISRTKNGTPDFSRTDACVAETEVRQRMSSTTDYKHAFEQMVAEGKLDPNEYSQNDSGHVIRRQTVIVDGNPTVVETDYTVHHVQYDVNTGMGSFQLVESDAHLGIKHAGGDSQLQHAYGKYGAGEAISSYNDSVQNVNDQLNPKSKISKIPTSVKAVKQGGQSGGKVVDTNSSIETSYELSYDPDFTFLAAE